MCRFTWCAFVVMVLSCSPSLANDALIGRWINVDDKTNDLTRFEISQTDEGLLIQAWGAAGRGGEMDQGKVPLKLLADTAGATHSDELKYGYAVWDHKFMETHLTIRLEKNWLMTAEDLNLFKDNSGRSNYRVETKFKKVTADKPQD
jgi:hypothetical protein